MEGGGGGRERDGGREGERREGEEKGREERTKQKRREEGWMNTCDANFLILPGTHPASLLPCISHYVLMGSFTLKLFCMVGLGG